MLCTYCKHLGSSSEVLVDDLFPFQLVTEITIKCRRNCRFCSCNGSRVDLLANFQAGSLDVIDS